MSDHPFQEYHTHLFQKIINASKAEMDNWSGNPMAANKLIKHRVDDNALMLINYGVMEQFIQTIFDDYTAAGNTAFIDTCMFKTDDIPPTNDIKTIFKLMFFHTYVENRGVTDGVVGSMLDVIDDDPDAVSNIESLLVRVPSHTQDELRLVYNDNDNAKKLLYMYADFKRAMKAIGVEEGPPDLGTVDDDNIDLSGVTISKYLSTKTHVLNSENVFYCVVLVNMLCAGCSVDSDTYDSDTSKYNTVISDHIKDHIEGVLPRINDGDGTGAFQFCDPQDSNGNIKDGLVPPIVQGVYSDIETPKDNYQKQRAKLDSIKSKLDNANQRRRATMIRKYIYLALFLLYLLLMIAFYIIHIDNISLITKAKFSTVLNTLLLIALIVYEIVMYFM